jgi:hypothetical protein
MIKKLFFILPFATALALNSCGGGCDASTADGAAKCMCEMMKEYEAVENDEVKAKEMDDKFDKFDAEVEKNIKDGKYTENDVEEALKKIEDCKM